MHSGRFSTQVQFAVLPVLDFGFGTPLGFKLPNDTLIKTASFKVICILIAVRIDKSC